MNGCELARHVKLVMCRDLSLDHYGFDPELKSLMFYPLARREQ